MSEQDAVEQPRNEPLVGLRGIPLRGVPQHNYQDLLEWLSVNHPDVYEEWAEVQDEQSE